MKNLFPIFFSLAMLAQLSACKVGDDTSTPVRDQYFFDQLYTLTNVKKTYLPDDFIFMEYSLPDKMMTDSATGQSIRVGNARMFPSLDIFGPLDGSLAGEDRFSYTLVEGEVVEGDDDFEEQGSLLFNIGCPDNLDYQLKVNLKFPKPGGYLMFLDYSAASALHSFPFTADDNCSVVAPTSISPNADIGFVQFFFDVDDTNRDEYDAYVANIPNWDTVGAVLFEQALDEKRAFFVRVVE